MKPLGYLYLTTVGFVGVYDHPDWISLTSWLRCWLRLTSVTTGVDWESLSKEKQILARKTRAKAVLGLTKYTTRAAGTKGTGWSEEGLDKFNKLCKQVAENWASDKGKFEHKKVQGKPS
jgi:hypothetical protein